MAHVVCYHSFCFQEYVKLELVEDVLRLLEINLAEFEWNYN